MATLTSHDLESDIRRHRALTPETVNELRQRQRQHAALAPRRGTPGLGALGHRLPDLARAGRFSRMRPPARFLSGDWPSALMCIPGFAQLDSAVGVNRYGSDGTPRLGPLIDPPPAGFQDGPPLHAYSVMTRDETSEISIAAAIAVNNLPTFGGYDVTNHPYPNDDTTVGWNISGSISQLFYLPDLPGAAVSRLEASARVTNDHSIDDLVTAYVAFAPDGTDPSVTVQGFVVLKVYQGLAALFGGPPSTFTSWNKLFEYEYDRIYGRYGPGDRMQDGVMDIDVIFPYDGVSTVFVVEVSINLDLCIAPDGSSPCFAAFDARFADDDRTLVVPDGVLAGDSAVQPGSSCPFAVSDFIMCASAT